MNNKQWFGPESIHPNIGTKTDFICGVEHELEGLAYNWHEVYCNAFTHDEMGVDEDGSLAGGKEFITVPRGVENQILWHQRLHGLTDMFNGERVSERTSIHVHVNMINMTREQTLSLLTAYCLLEPFFFAYVGQQREQNIHCVPLWATHMPKLIYGNTPETYKKIPASWHKYTALNLKPLREIGTIEFRHLEGTEDNQQFSSWLYLIKALYDWAFVDNGKLITDLPSILQAGPKAWQDMYLSWPCTLSRYLNKLLPYTNQERLEDVFLFAATNVFPGIQNPKLYLKA